MLKETKIKKKTYQQKQVIKTAAKMTIVPEMMPMIINPAPESSGLTVVVDISRALIHKEKNKSAKYHDKKK